MYRSSPSKCILLSVLIVAGFFPKVLWARIDLGINYSLSVESHTDEDDQVNSNLNITLQDEVRNSKGSLEIDLNTDLIYDHKSEQSNQQYTGNLFAYHDIYTPAFRWELGGNIQVLPENQDEDIDHYSSQNIAYFETGPRISLSRSIRGSLDVDLKVGTTDYSEENLDSKQSDIRLIYFYPFSSSRSVQLTLDQGVTKYDDVSVRQFDSKIDTVQVVYLDALRDLDYEIVLGTNFIDADLNSTTESSFSLNFDYRLNTFSTISFDTSESVVELSEFNQELLNQDNAILDAGVVKRKRNQLVYNYNRLRDFFNLLIYQDKVINLSGGALPVDTITGINTEFTKGINRNLSMGISVNVVRREISSQFSDDLDIRFTCSINHSQHFSSRFSLGEERESEEQTQFESENSFFAYEMEYQFR